MMPTMTKGYPGDVRDTYLDGTVLGVVGGMLSVVMEGADQGIRAVSGREYEAPSGMFGRMQRDVSATINHLFSREFLKAGSAAWSAISGNIIMDIWDLLNGKHR
jgi:hypothetical protein